MQRELPIAVCVFGWGETFRLYPNHLHVNGKNYPLIDLTYLKPTYRNLMGIPSARLELHFGRTKLLFRGIAAVEDAQAIVNYLSPWCINFNLPKTGTDWDAGEFEVLNERERIDLSYRTRDAGQTQQTGSQPTLQQYSPITPQDPRLRALTHATTLPVETPTPQQPPPRRQKRLRGERFQFARYLREDSLPVVPVPVRLLPGEQAHYSTNATLCGERIGESIRYTYPAQDQGTLILTNKRVIYIGRKSQVVLDYTRLLHVSRLRGAIAFEAEHWQKRAIFEMPQPLECSMFLECILERFRREEQVQVAEVMSQDAEGKG